MKLLQFTRCVEVALTKDHQSPSLLSENLCCFAITTEFDHLIVHSCYLYLTHTTPYQLYNRPRKLYRHANGVLCHPASVHVIPNARRLQLWYPPPTSQSCI